MTEILGDIFIFGVSMVVFIPLLVEGFISLGMPDSWKKWVTLVLCFLAAIASVLLDLNPGVQGPLYVAGYTVLSGLVLWLIVSGIYQVAQNVSIGGKGPPTIPPNQGEGDAGK